MNLVLVRPLGSPPRMRGKVKACRLFTLAVGITPAYAGKRFLLPSRFLLPRDHPCVCGEKSGHNGLQLGILGITPACAGKRKAVLGLCTHVRITPAYAGKRCSARTPTFRTWDHPRVCGEKRRPSSHSHTLPGSPPRVRGKVSAGKILLHDGGITPAHAGKSFKKRPRSCGLQDHPRACGEKASALL